MKKQGAKASKRIFDSLLVMNLRYLQFEPLLKLKSPFDTIIKEQ